MESCESVCSKNGLICSEKEFRLHNNEVDSSDEVLKLIEKLGGTTSATLCVSANYPAVPLFNHKSYCMYSGKSQPSIFSCTTVPGPPESLKQRICYCTHTAIGIAVATGM